MLKMQENIRTNGLGMGEVTQVTSSVSFGTMVVASGITAAAMALGSIIVKGVEFYVFREDNGEVILASDDGIEVRFKSIQDAEAKWEQLGDLIKDAKEKVEADAKKAKDAEEKADEEKADKEKADEDEGAAKKDAA